MSISAIASSSTLQTAALQQQAGIAATPTRTREQEHDGDTDDSVATAAAIKPPTLTVNLNGQTVGQTIDVTA